MIIKATIYFDTLSTHPDTKGKALKHCSFTDTYTIDPLYFSGSDSIDSYIKDDLALVAGGGYNTNHINNVSFSLDRSAQ